MSNYSNNGQNINPYNNGGGYNPYNQYNNADSQNRPEQRKVNSVKNTSICYIVFLILSIIFVIAAYAFFVDAVFKSVNNEYIYIDTDIYTKYLAFMALGIIFSLATFIIAIVLSIKTSFMRKYWREFDSIFILAVVGIFIPILTLVASCMAISKINRMKNDNNGPNYDSRPY